MVGLSNVDNTADPAKIVSGPQSIAVKQRGHAIATTAPLRKEVTVLSNITTLSIDPMEDLSINSLAANGTVTVDTIIRRSANEVTVDCNFAVDGTLLVDAII